MSSQMSLLTEEQRKRWEVHSIRVERKLIDLEDRQLADPPEVAAQIRDIFQQAHDSQRGDIRPWYRAAFIQVVPNDGMSWTAETAARAAATMIQKRAGSWRMEIVKPVAPRELPHLARLVSTRRLLECIAKRDPALHFVTLRSICVALLLAMAVVSVLVPALLANSSADTGLASRLNSPIGYLTMSLAAVLAVFSYQLRHEFSTRSFAAAVRTFASMLDDDTYLAAMAKRDDLVEDLKTALSRHDQPRVVIVEDFEGLDPLTQAVLVRYHKQGLEVPHASDYWIVFEHTDGAKLSPHLLQIHGHAGSDRMRVFRQLLLDMEDKRRLISGLNLPATAADYDTVTSICEESKRMLTQVTVLLDDHMLRARQAATPSGRYDTLDLLYVFAINFSVRGRDLRMDRLINLLSLKGGATAAILPELLPGTKRVKQEFREQAEQMLVDFRSLISRTDSGEYSWLRMAPEVAQTVCLWGDPVLRPPKRLGHLFWALVWSGRLGASASASALRQAGQHLLKSGISELTDDREAKGVVQEVADACIAAAAQSLNACVFGQVAPILEYAGALLEEEQFACDPASRSRLTRVVWQAYSLLGDERLLAMLLNVDLDPDEPFHHEAVSEVDQLFADSVSLGCSADGRRIFLDGLRGEDHRASIAAYGRARTAWMATALLCHPSGDLSPDRFQRVVKESMAVLLDTLRLWDGGFGGDHSGTPGALEVTTISMALWARTLPARMGPLPPVYAASLRADLERATYLAGELNQLAHGSELSGGHAFVLRALAMELGAIALTSFQVSHFRAPEDPAIVESFNAIVRFCSETFEFAVDPISNVADLGSDELVADIDRLLRSMVMFWRNLELDRIADLLALRRLRALAYLRGGEMPEDDFVLLADLARPSGDPFVAVLASALLLDGQEDGTALAHQSLLDVAVQPGMSPRLRAEIALLGLVAQRTPAVKAPDLLRFMLSDDVRPTLAEYFSGSRGAVRVANRLLYLGAEAGGELRERVRCSLRELPVDAQPEDSQAEIECLLALDEMKATLEAPQPNLEEIVEAWAKRKGSWAYAMMAARVLPRVGRDHPLWRDAIDELSSASPDDSWNTRVLLAFELGKRMRDGWTVDARDRSVVVSYLAEGLERFRSSLEALTILEGYELLLELDSERASEYTPRLEAWRNRVAESDQRRLLPTLVNQGRFYLVLQRYWKTYREWGLRSVGSRRLVPPRSDDECRVLVNEATNRPIPPAVERTQEGLAVSLDFLILAEATFSPALEETPQLERRRRAIDEAAKRAYRPLVELVLSLDGIPSKIKELVALHARRFDIAQEADAGASWVEASI